MTLSLDNIRNKQSALQLHLVTDASQNTIYGDQTKPKGVPQQFGTPLPLSPNLRTFLVSKHLNQTSVTLTLPTIYNIKLTYSYFGTQKNILLMSDQKLLES